jgi:hypothetical protein
MCLRLGLAPLEALRLVLDRMRWLPAFDILGVMKQRMFTGEAVVLRKKDRLLTEEEAWAILRMSAAVTADRMSHALAEVSRHIKPDREYVSKLAAVIVPDRPDASYVPGLEVLLSQIPVIWSFDPIFNARVARISRVNNVPCVLVYYHTFLTIRALMELALGGLFDGSKRVLPAYDAGEAGKRTVFMRALKKVLDAAWSAAKDVGEIPEEMGFGSGRRNTLREFSLALRGGIDFVWLHEYAHIVLGHAETDRSADEELAADTLALEALVAQCASNPTWKRWVVIGANLTLSLVELMDRMRPGPSGVHPTASVRLVNLVETAPAKARPELKRVATSLERLFAPTVEAWTGTAGIRVSQ